MCEVISGLKDKYDMKLCLTINSLFYSQPPFYPKHFESMFKNVIYGEAIQKRFLN